MTKLSMDQTSILFADIKGYSRLSDRQLQTFSEEVLPRLSTRISGHSLDHVNTWGDGIVITSKSIRQISQIGLDMRDFFLNFDWDYHHLQRLDIRVSLHMGQFLRGEDMFTKGGLAVGQSVILAARIEPVVIPGQVWVTEAFANSVREDQQRATNRIIACDEIGEVRLPKGAGVTKVFLLRRSHEAALSSEDRERILGDTNLRHTHGSERNAEVVVGVVVHEGKVVLVKRKKGSDSLDWMFPSAKKFPTDDEKYTVVKEVKEETGLSCAVRSKIATIARHPVTGATCHFYHLVPIGDTDIRNGDPAENDEVMWVPIGKVREVVGAVLSPVIESFLVEQPT